MGVTRITSGQITDSAIEDADGNTKVECEESADENKIRFSTAGSERMIIDENGGVGIGLSNPSNSLYVYANISNNYVAVIDNDSGSNAHGLKITSDGTGTGTTLLDVESASTTVFKVRGDGRVGIGVDTPGSTLSVDDEISVGEKLIHRGDPDTYLQFPGQNQVILAANGHAFLTYDGNIKINDGDRDRDTQIMADDGNVILHVDAGDNRVGIGTTSPVCELDVNGTVRTKAFGVNVRDVNSTSSVDALDYVLRCIQNQAITITLPAKNTSSGRVLIFKDVLGNASTNNITIDGDSSDTIDGNATFVMNQNRQSVTLICDGINGWMIVGTT